MVLWVFSELGKWRLEWGEWLLSRIGVLLFEDTNGHLKRSLHASLAVPTKFYIVTFMCIIVFPLHPVYKLLTRVPLCPGYCFTVGITQCMLGDWVLNHRLLSTLFRIKCCCREDYLWILVFSITIKLLTLRWLSFPNYLQGDIKWIFLHACVIRDTFIILNWKIKIDVQGSFSIFLFWFNLWVRVSGIFSEMIFKD